MTDIQSANVDEYEGAPDDRLALLEWPSTGERLTRESFQRYRKIGGPVAMHTNTDEMVAVAITSPLTMIASDAYWEGEIGHPRTTGTFSRVLARYVREAGTLSLMDAIRKMTLDAGAAPRAACAGDEIQGTAARRGRCGHHGVRSRHACSIGRPIASRPCRPPASATSSSMACRSSRTARLVEGAAPGRAVRAPVGRP